MSDAEKVYRWEQCNRMATKLGLTLQSNGENLFLRKNQTQCVYTSGLIEGIMGYLDGMTEERKNNEPG